MKRKASVGIAALVWAAIVCAAAAEWSTRGALHRWLSYELRGTVSLDGRRVYLDPHDRVMTGTLIRFGEHDPIFRDLLERTIRPGDKVIDVGAHIGYYTVLAARAAGPQGRVVAFEPDPTSFGYLVRNVTENRYRNVVLEQKAVCDKAGTLLLYLSPHNTEDHRTFPAEDKRESIEVRTVALDEYLGADFPANFVKIDTQGAEVEILSGMTQILKHKPVVAIEFWPYGLARAGATAKQLLSHFPPEIWKMEDVDEKRGGIFETTAEELLKRYTLSNGEGTNLFLTPRHG